MWLRAISINLIYCPVLQYSDVLWGEGPFVYLLNSACTCFSIFCLLSCCHLFTLSSVCLLTSASSFLSFLGQTNQLAFLESSQTKYSFLVTVCGTLQGMSGILAHGLCDISTGPQRFAFITSWFRAGSHMGEVLLCKGYPWNWEKSQANILLMFSPFYRSSAEKSNLSLE